MRRHRKNGARRSPWALAERLAEPLLATLAEKVIAPAEGKVKVLEERRRKECPLSGQRTLATSIVPMNYDAFDPKQSSGPLSDITGPF
jgi:hypothetical protein